MLLALTLVLPGSAVTAKADGQGDMAVHFIDVGQGLAILVQSGGENLLYDGVNRSQDRPDDLHRNEMRSCS